MSRSVMRNVCSDTSKVNVTLQGQMIKVLVRAVTFIFMDGIQNDLAQLFSLMSRSVMRKVCSDFSKVKVTLEG